jgi:hypothetical protein
MKPTKPTQTPDALEPDPAAWPSIAAARGSRAAFAEVALAGPVDRADRRLLEAALFEGRRCTELACALGVEPAEIRRRLGATMLALHAARIGDPGEGAVPAMLALHALDALDPDEAALVDAMLAHRPALRRMHAGYRELVGELCLQVAPVLPPPCRVPPEGDVRPGDAIVS